MVASSRSSLLLSSTHLNISRNFFLESLSFFGSSSFFSITSRVSSILRVYGVVMPYAHFRFLRSRRRRTTSFRRSDLHCWFSSSHVRTCCVSSGLSKNSRAAASKTSEGLKFCQFSLNFDSETNYRYVGCSLC